MSVGYLECVGDLVYRSGIGADTSLYGQFPSLHHFDMYNTSLFYDHVSKLLSTETDHTADILAIKMHLWELFSQTSIFFHGIISYDEYAQHLARRDPLRHAAIVRVYVGVKLVHHFAVCWQVLPGHEAGLMPDMGERVAASGSRGGDFDTGFPAWDDFGERPPTLAETMNDDEERMHR